MSKIIFFSLLSLNLHATTLINLEDVAREPNGEVLLLTLEEASQYCLERATRLPTIEELASYGELHGAKKVKTSYPEIPSDSYEAREELVSFASQGKYHTEHYEIKYADKGSFVAVDYYYFFDKYRCPENDLCKPTSDEGYTWYWSGTRYPQSSKSIYVFRPSGGYMMSILKEDSYGAVRCLKP